MKANEAPEKIYIDPATDLPKLSGHIDKDSVEYIKKDAFIKKACAWLKEQDEMTGVSFQEDFLERFQNYMKGE